VGLINRIKQIIRELEQTYNREPTPTEISSALKIPNVEVVEAMNGGAFHLSLDQSFQDSDGGNMKDIIINQNSNMPDSDLIKESLKKEILSVLKRLTPREEKVLKLYFGLSQRRPLTLEEIGDIIGLTRERVRQIKEQALTRLRRHSHTHNLRFFL
jgi:RNA polymerase primary sigma factor